MKSIAVLFFICIITNSFAQDYKTAIGIKGGYPGYGTINVKHFLTSATAIEGSIGRFSRSNYGNGAMGLEYTFDEVPINCSLNTGPILFFSPNVTFNWGGGLAIRYAIR
jgi:hypothetical protein